MRKIFVTGGHFAPAKAVIAHLNNWQIFYLGRKYAMEDEKSEALEFREIKNVHYLVITTGRLQRKFFINISQSIKSLFKIPLGFIQSFYYLIRYRPNIVLSFGGYVALPIVINAWILDIPVITHEQTESMGLANKIIALFAEKTLKFPIIRSEIIKAKIQNKNLIYITGGNQGSHTINLAIEKIIKDLIKKYQVIHQTGDSSYHDFEKAPKIKNYEVYKFLTAEKSAKVLAESKIIISRAGANTVNEIAFLGKPAIFIPIPWASGDEQQKNAQKLVDLGMAEIIPQDQLSGEILLKTIEKIEKNYDQYFQNAKKAKSLTDPLAAKKIVKEISVIASEAKQFSVAGFHPAR